MHIVLLLFQDEKTTRTITKTVVSYNSTITYVVVVLVIVWVFWNLISIYRINKSKRRPAIRKKDLIPKKFLIIKDELSAIWLKKGTSTKVHAVGIGKLENGGFCIQIFVNNSDEKIQISDFYKEIPIVFVEMPNASFLSAPTHTPEFTREEYKKIIRDKQDVIIGGISGANTNLNGEYGTIGYFCRKKSLIRQSKEIYMLSNSHVFADLRKPLVDEHDLIMQPSPGESAASRPIGELKLFSHPKLDNNIDDANFVDAAIAKLWTNNEVHKPIIPMIGKIIGYVEKKDVEIGESSRKFGRTTGFTKGNVFSVYLDIWVRFDRTGESSFFKNQFLIENESEFCEKFVEKGDSGSVVVDRENFVSGLIFAGANGEVEIKNSSDDENKIYQTVNNYGVANPISEVLKRLNIELLL